MKPRGVCGAFRSRCGDFSRSGSSSPHPDHQARAHVRLGRVRALAILAGWANEHPEAGIVIPTDPFIDLLNSVSWSDRNKGVFALISLTDGRDPVLLTALHARALPSLVEMARWTNPGHALAAYMILARIVGMDDAAAFQAYQAGERESVIARATSSTG